MELVILLYCAL